MAGKRSEGPLCKTRDGRIDSGTLCRNESDPPAPVGLDIAIGAERVKEAALDIESDAAAFVDECITSLAAETKSVVISLLDLIPLKPDSPYATQLLKHYVEGTGHAYEIQEVPKDWQDWIVQGTRGRPGIHRSLNPYNSGIYDLRNSLGHFDVTVVSKNRTKIYTITDTYEFGYMKGDTQQRHRHGFPVGRVSDRTLAAIRWLLPSDEYWNPGGFAERWEIRSAGGETILYIPQAVLAQQGRSFRVTGTFTR